VSVGHYENFPVASLLLPRSLRRPVALIYHFARTADDYADEGNEPRETRLENLRRWRDQLEQPKEEFFEKLRQIRLEHELPLQLFHDLLDAFTQDVVKNRYADFAEVLDYCRRSANPVGRLLLHLFKRVNETTLAQSDRVCSALQLINFWQDVGTDYAARDRIYLPRDEMQRFGVDERQIAERRVDDAFRALLRFQAERARRLMLDGKPLLDALRGRFRLEIAVTVESGLRILEKLEQADYDMFRHRPVLKWFDWPSLLYRAL
jgi:squalene synthase HpnC